MTITTYNSGVVKSPKIGGVVKSLAYNMVANSKTGKLH